MGPSEPIEKSWRHISLSTNWHQSQRMKKMAERKKKREVESSLKRLGYPAPLATVLSKTLMDKSWTTTMTG
jgi:hypothetical protein